MTNNTENVSDDTQLSSYWVSWYHDSGYGSYLLYWPWWVSGRAGDAATICAAVKAASEEAAKDIIMSAYDIKPASITWRFVEKRPPDWSPFNSRFNKSDWMKWE